MAFELSPLKQTSVSLTNAAWVFITDILRQQPYGSMVDSSQQDLLVQINTQIIAANQPEMAALTDALLADADDLTDSEIGAQSEFPEFPDLN